MKRSSVEVLKTLGNLTTQAGPKVVTALALALSLSAGSCSNETDRFSGDTYRLPWPDAEGQMALRDVKINTLTDPEKFEGSAAKILIEPAESNGKLIAEKPRGRYIRAGNGTMIATNYATLQAVTAYAHQEKLQEFDRKNGVETYLNWPLTVGLQVKVSDRGSLVNNNAIYDGKLDALLVVPYNLPELPIAFNAGILAHEHFHFIFQKAVLNKIGVQQSQGCQHGVAQTEVETETGDDLDLDDEEAIAQAADQISPAIYNSFLLRAMNEGLADFWGWAYSSDTVFVGRSLPSEDRLRRLDLEPGRLGNSKTIRESLVDLRRGDKVIREEYRVGRAYLLGTQYARFLRELVDASVQQGQSLEDAKQTVAKALMKALPVIADAAVNSYAKTDLSPNIFIKPMTLHLGDLKKPLCETIESFRAPEPGYEKPSACTSPGAAQ